MLLREFYIKNPLSNVETPVEISFARINPDDEFKRFVGVIRDVTEQKKSDKLRDDFIATLTHDLRTPLLAAIQTLTFFLDGALGELDEKQKLLLSTMQKSNEDLLGLVNALLEVYKYDADKLTLTKTNFNIYNLVEQVYNELLPLAQKKSIDFEISCDGFELHRSRVFGLRYADEWKSAGRNVLLRRNACVDRSIRKARILFVRHESV